MSPARSFVALVVGPETGLSAHLQELSELGGTVKRAESAYAAMAMLCGERIDVVVFEYSEEPECGDLIDFLATSRTALLTIVVADPGRENIPLGDSAILLRRPLQPGDLRTAVQGHYDELFNEKREQLRVPLRVPVTIMMGSAQYVATSTDVGHQGMGVRLPVPLPFREALEVSFELPGAPRKIRATGQISWMDSWGHAGIHIFDLSPEIRSTLAAWIAEQRDACTSMSS